MQHDLKTSPPLGHIHEYSTSSHSYKPGLNTSTFSRYSPPESPRHLPSFFTNGTGSSAINGDSAMSSGPGHGHPYSHQAAPPSSHHRGLPPPPSAAFSLPPPTPISSEPHYRSSSAAPLPPAPQPSQHHSLSTSTTLGHLPAPPSSWSTSASNNDDAMRSWLQAKIEEDRRKGEEEKTRQETLRLDRRRMERDMLRDSLERGIPPAMVPLIFAGIGGSGTEGSVGQAMEFAQNWMQNFSLQQQTPSTASDAQRMAYEQQLRHPQMIASASSPDLRREREQREVRDRMIPPNPYASQQPPPLSSHRASFSAAAPPSGALSKLNTVDFAPPTHRQQLHPTLSASNLSLRGDRDELHGPPSGSVLTSGQATGNTSSGQGPGIFFHHWTPPTGGSAAAGATSTPSGMQQPPTPSTKSMQGSPFGSQGSNTGGTSTTNIGTHGHLRKQVNSDAFENSPKKRKTTHQTGSGSSGGSAAGAERSGGPVPAAALAAVREQHQPPPHSQLQRRPSEDDAGGSGSDEGRGRETEQRRGSREALRPSSRQLRREEEEDRRYEDRGGSRPPPG